MRERWIDAVVYQEHLWNRNARRRSKNSGGNSVDQIGYRWPHDGAPFVQNLRPPPVFPTLCDPPRPVRPRSPPSITISDVAGCEVTIQLPVAPRIASLHTQPVVHQPHTRETGFVLQNSESAFTSDEADGGNGVRTRSPTLAPSGPRSVSLRSLPSRHGKRPHPTVHTRRGTAWASVRDCRSLRV